MRTTPIAKSSDTIDIAPIKTRSVEVCVLGHRPIILNRMPHKAQQELLLPKGRKTTADRAATLKHDPLAEFRDSPYTSEDDDAPTVLELVPSAFKQAMETAALDIEGVQASKIKRNVWVEGERVGLYGVPEMLMSVVRSADINKTPDIHTRAIVPAWAARLVVSFAVPMLNERSVVNLLAAAGQICGVGDWRPEKGSGTYGQFVLVDPDDARFLAVLAGGGRAAQQAALDDPAAYNRETEELFAWFSTEVLARGRTATRAAKVATAEAAD